MLVLPILTAGLAAPPTGAVTPPPTKTLVFDALVKNRFVDRAPVGPSRGDAELSTSKLRDPSGHIVGSTRGKCVFTKKLANDVLERCTGTAKTSEGAVTLSGVGHLNSMNPPWNVTGRSGAYRGLRGKQVFATDIPFDPGVPLSAGRFFSVVVIQVATNRRIHVGLVPRPAANASFLRRANAACDAAQRTANRLPGFPFSNFDPFHPDPSVLPQVGEFFNQPARRRLPATLLRKLKKLGQPPAGGGAWQNVLEARRRLLANQNQQIRAALADDTHAFVRTLRPRSRDYNGLVFMSAVFGAQACTFS